MKKDELLRTVWGDTQVSEDGLRDYLREIRHALHDDAEAPRFVETVRGRGYRFLPSTTAPPVASRREAVSGPQLTTENRQLTTQLVGRESTLTQLHRLLAKAMAGERHCEQLAGRQQFLRRLGVEAWPDGTLAARYGFLHALYQQLWHERVTPTQLHLHHLQIGERKEHTYGERAREIAAELAVHFEQGREYRKAVQYLQLAGENALRLSAPGEAISSIRKGLTILKQIPETVGANQQEIGLQIILGNALSIAQGYATPEAGPIYARARELCHSTADHSLLFPSLIGLWRFSFTRGDCQTSQDFGQQLLHHAERTQDLAHLLVAHQTLGLSLFHLAEFKAAQAHLEQGLTLHSQHLRRFAGVIQSPGLTCLSYLSWTLWHLGYPDQARQRSQEALT